MADIPTATELKQAIKNASDTMVLYSAFALQHRSDAWAHYYAGEDHEAIADILSALSDTAYVADLGYGSWEPYPVGGPLFQWLKHYGGGEELTLLAFIEAYIEADDDHRTALQLLFDAFQASMYSKPFDMEYHKNWVRRFTSWA